MLNLRKATYKQNILIFVANLCKSCYINWAKDSVENETILYLEMSI